MPAIDPLIRARAFLRAALLLVLAAAALAQDPPDHLHGEQPYEEPSHVSPSDDWLPSFVPNLIDLPAAELSERGHPMLELGIRRRSFDGAAFDNVVSASQNGARFALHIRAGRDLQLSIEAPVLEPQLALEDGTAVGLPGTLGAAAFELKFLSPYEVVGVRTAVGFRFSAFDEDDVVLFTPDEFTRLQSAYVTFGAYLRSDVRVHLTAMSVFARGVPAAPSPDYGLLGGGFEFTAFERGDNYVRLIAELISRDFDGPEHGFYGRILRGDDAFANAGIRVRSGILQIDVGTRHVAQQGWDEQYATLVKRF